MAIRDSVEETIGSHADAVRRAVGATDDISVFDWWPDDAPADVDGAASWNYVTGYANALDMTAKELISELGV